MRQPPTTRTFFQVQDYQPTNHLRTGDSIDCPLYKPQPQPHSQPTTTSLTSHNQQQPHSQVTTNHNQKKPATNHPRNGKKKLPSSMGGIKVHGAKYSPFSKRVELALKIKGVEYDFVEEDLQNKSSELVKYNPVHKKIPVLVHHGKPVAESLVILEYVDEAFDGVSLLPKDPYERALARFWAKFIDDKLVPAIRAIATSQGEEVEKAKKEAAEQLNYLEKEITGKKFFGGDSVGYVDVAGIIVAYWMPILQEATGSEVMLTKDRYPAICAWSETLISCDVFKQSLPERETMLAFFKARFQVAPPK